MKHRITALAVLVTLAVALAPITAPAQIVNRSVVVPITTVISGTTTPGPSGTFTILRFANQGGSLVAIGTVVLQGADGVAATPATIGVQQITGTCDILTLVLGPLHLDVLGLQVDLNQVILEIVAQSGAGNLLGNLLCAIAGLLDPAGGPLTGLLNQLVFLLNRILAILG